MATIWGQNAGYNDFAPYLGCNSATETSNGRAWAGCVATAMGQIMKYNQKPSTWNWSAMPNTPGSVTTSLLLKDIGDNVDMDYQCTGSAAATYDGYLSFKNDYGYSSAQYDNYNYQTVISNLDNLHPVVLAGGKYSGWWIFATYDSGHAWVTDGYHTYNFCESGTYLYLHMNWGREGSQDGFYAYDYWSPPYHYYESSKEMIYNLY